MEDEVIVVPPEAIEVISPPEPKRERKPRKRGSRRLPKTEKQLASYNRAKSALALVARGVPYREVAQQLGYKSVASVHEAVHKLLDDYGVEHDVDKVKELELEKLDIYERELMEIVRKGGKGAPRAIEVAMKLQERRSALLGLDVAQQHEVNVHAPTFYDYERDPRQEERQRRVAALLGESAGGS